jgi:hypothetical protein
MWSERCDSDCFLQRLFEMIRSRDHAWSSHRQFSSDRLVSLFSEWRMLILDYRMTYACSRFVERRLWWDVKLNEASYQTWSETTHQTWRERLVKLDESDSSSLTRATHQSWRKKRHLIKLDESVISSNLTRASSHQTWRERHLIKLLRRKTVFLLFDEQFCNDTWCEELSLAENHLLCEDCYDKWAFLMKVERWYNSAFSYKERASSYVKTMSDCRRSDNSSS